MKLSAFFLIGTALSIVLLAQGTGTRAQDTSAQGRDAFEQNKRLGRGVNVLGYDPIWKDRSRGRFQAEHFRLIHEAGFSHVRINLHPFRDCGSTITDSYFQTLDWAVEQALANKLMVILDFHEFNAMARDPNGLKERFLATWTRISERYKNQPGEVLFEILNEPNGKLTPELWNQYLREALAIIRRTNPVRTVVIGPGQWNQIAQLDKLELPEADRNVIVTVHSYTPMDFTHQGASWAGRRDKVGVSWDGTPKEKEALTTMFDQAQAWSQKHNRPIHLGEFGVYDKAEMASRVRYLDFVTREAEKRGWSWAYWQFDSDFILYDIPGKRWIEPVRDALIPPPGERTAASGGPWRALPLITDGKVDPAWAQVGWGGFVVDGGALRTECDDRGMGILLYKAQKFGDCQIRVVYRREKPTSNAGVFVRLDDGVLAKIGEKSPEVHRDAKGKLSPEMIEKLKEASEKHLGGWYPVHHGYEVQILDDTDPWHRTGAIYSLAKAEPVPEKPLSEWRTMIIVLDGERITVDVDGSRLSSFDAGAAGQPPRKNWTEPIRELKRPTHGYIGLQNHDPGDVVWFKEVSVQPLDCTK